MPEFTMDQILDALDQHHQRATYSAVAALLDRQPRTLMQGRDRNPRSSWIVSRKNGEPTGYTTDDVHPSLRERDVVIDSKEELTRWLSAVIQ